MESNLFTQFFNRYFTKCQINRWINCLVFVLEGKLEQDKRKRVRGGAVLLDLEWQCYQWGGLTDKVSFRLNQGWGMPVTWVSEKRIFRQRRHQVQKSQATPVFRGEHVGQYSRFLHLIKEETEAQRNNFADPSVSVKLISAAVTKWTNTPT